MTWLMAGWCADAQGAKDRAAGYRTKAEACPTEMVFPSRVEELAAARQALQAGTDASRAAYYAGLVLMRLLRYEEAIAAWEQAVAARDDNSVARRCLGVTLAAVRQDRQAAIAHLERATAIDPRQPMYYQDLADLYTALQRPAEARNVLARAVRNTPATDALVTDLAEAYLVVGEYLAATETLAKHQFNVTEGRYGVHDDYAAAWIGVGLEALQDDKPSEALAALDKALEYPRNLAIGKPADAQDESMIHFWRGVALRQLHRDEEAVQAFEQSASQAANERSRRRSFYGAVNTAHGVLALRALGRSQEAGERLEQLTRGPATRRWMHGDWYRAVTAFRQAWTQVLRGDAPTAAPFAALTEDSYIPGQWPRLSMLAAEVLQGQGAVASLATQPAASEPTAGP